MASDDGVGAAHVIGNAVELGEGTRDRPGPLPEPTVDRLAEVDRSAALNHRDRPRATPEADRRDRSPALHEHADAAMDGRVEQIVSEIGDLYSHCRIQVKWLWSERPPRRPAA